MVGVRVFSYRSTGWQGCVGSEDLASWGRGGVMEDDKQGILEIGDMVINFFLSDKYSFIFPLQNKRAIPGYMKID